MEPNEDLKIQFRKLLERYYQITLELKASLQQMEEEHFIDTLNKLIDEREEVVQNLKRLQENSGISSLSEAVNEPELINKISSLEKEISSKLNAYKDTQGQHIKQINQGKLTYNAYSGYMPSTDGVFFDKKK